MAPLAPKRCFDDSNKENTAPIDIFHTVWVDQLPQEPAKKKYRPTVKRSRADVLAEQAEKIARRKADEERDVAARVEENARAVEEQRLKEALEAEAAVQEADAERVRKTEEKLSRVLDAIRHQGWTFDEFFTTLMESKAQQRSSHVSRILSEHGKKMLDSMLLKRREVVRSWVKEQASVILNSEGRQIAKRLRPDTSRGISETLAAFSMEDTTGRARLYAPTLWAFLERVGRTQGDLDDDSEIEGEPAEHASRRRDRNLVSPRRPQCFRPPKLKVSHSGRSLTASS